MSELRPFALVRDGDQWVRSSFDGTFLDHEEGIVSLAWTAGAQEGAAPPVTAVAGLAFDAECRLYHAVPEAGRVDRVRWAARDPLSPDAGDAAPVPLFAGGGAQPLGDFAGPAPDALQAPRGLAVDVDDRLFVVDGERVLVYDLWSNRLLRRVSFAGEGPTDLAAHGATVYAVLQTSQRVVRLSVRAGAIDVPLPPSCDRPSRVAMSPATGRLAVLARAGTPTARVYALDSAGVLAEAFDEPYASDVEWESETVLVVARRPGADFTRRRLGAPAVERMPPLRARGYDGRGIVRTPERIVEPAGHECRCGGACGCDGGSAGGSWRIGYWSDRGFRRAVPARLAYVPNGRLVTYRLDSGQYATQWGRVFLDACVPEGTSIRLHAITADDVDEDEPLAPRVPPANLEQVTIARPDLSPPMPPAAQVPNDLGLPVHRRESGRELPWAQPASDDPFRTYEAPVLAPAGRYLWLVLELRGTTHLSPRVRCIRAEHPSHDYLRRIPRLFSRDEVDASFLRRYLAIAEGFLGETEARAADRNVLLTPRATPDDALPWLASFVGLVLDERWARAPRPGGRTADARRAIVAQAAWLFRFRGTVPGLKRFIELYVGVDVVILEKFRLRGLGGATLGDVSSSVLGGGFRVGGALGTAGGRDSGLGSSGPTPESRVPTPDAFATHAHRFTVLIPAALTEEQLDVVHHILDVHRPAHTIVDVCTVGAGMRVGRGLHVALSSMVGPTGGFQTLQLGGTALGRDAIVGRPTGGITADASRVGRDARVR